MILVDANLLLYAYDASSPQHEPARRWLENVMSGEEEIGFPLVALLAFVRIATNPSAFRRPMSARDAITIVASLLETGARIAEPTDRHWEILGELARSGRARGPLMMDAHVAALATEHGATLCSTDRDFARFPRLRLHDPLTD